MQCHTIKIVQKLDNYNRFNKKALLTPGSARDSSAAWWMGIQ